MEATSAQPGLVGAAAGASRPAAVVRGGWGKPTILATPASDDPQHRPAVSTAHNILSGDIYLQ